MEESAIALISSPGILPIATPNFGSATARDTFFSSFIESRSDESFGVTFPSIIAAASSRAAAALSYF